MNSDQERVGEVFETLGITFTFSNLKNLVSSDITYTEFLACVAQRILLKQYAAQTMDANNFLCPMSKTSEIFNENKESFKAGINELFLKPMTLSVINSQTSKNKITKDDQIKVATEFVKWYDDAWFNRLKSEKMLVNLRRMFEGSEVPEVKNSFDDWKKLSVMFSAVNEDVMFNEMGIDGRLLINNLGSPSPTLFENVLEDILKFIETTGNIDLPFFEKLVSDEKLILPTTSAFMMSTLNGIEEIEDRKKRYNAPLDPYNMFFIFDGNSMSHLLKMNQLLFTLYNYFKILL